METTTQLILNMYEDAKASKRMLTEIIKKPHFEFIYKPGEQESLKQLNSSTILKIDSLKSVIKNINQ